MELVGDSAEDVGLGAFFKLWIQVGSSLARLQK